MKIGGRRAFGRALLFLTAVALVLRLSRIDHFSLWLDEIMQAYFAHGSWKDFWGSLRFDAVHPPLDYLICRIVDFANPSDAVRRLPAVAWGTLTVPLLGILVSRRAGRLPALCSAALLAIAPFHVRYSQELRPYALGTLLVVAALLALDSFLGRPGAVGLAIVYAAFLAAAYTLYLAGVVAGLAAAAMLLEDSFDSDQRRRLSARRAILWSPAFAVALTVAYLPWLPVVRIAAARAAEPGPPPITAARYGSLFAFFSTASGEGMPVSARDLLLLIAVLLGSAEAIRQPRCRVFLSWVILGFLVIETLEQTHPHWPVARHFLQVGPALLALAGLGIAAAARRTAIPRLAAGTVLIFVLAAEARGLREYFDHGRPDWRPLARYLQGQGSGGRILTENQWIQLCLGYYLDGVASFHLHSRKPWEIITLQGDTRPIGWLWERGRPTWLVTCDCGARSERVKEFAVPYTFSRFPSADGSSLALLP
jgi:hypothetical protein